MKNKDVVYQNCESSSIGILENGPFVSYKEVQATTVDGEVILSHFISKKPTGYTEPEREKMTIDDLLQLIIFDSLSFDKIMCDKVIGYKSVKEI